MMEFLYNPDSRWNLLPGDTDNGCFRYLVYMSTHLHHSIDYLQNTAILLFLQFN